MDGKINRGDLVEFGFGAQVHRGTVLRLHAHADREFMALVALCGGLRNIVPVSALTKLPGAMSDGPPV